MQQIAKQREIITAYCDECARAQAQTALGIVDYSQIEQVVRQVYAKKVAQKVDRLRLMIELLEGDISKNTIVEVNRIQEAFNQELDLSRQAVQRHGVSVLGASQAQDLVEETLFVQLKHIIKDQKNQLARL